MSDVVNEHEHQKRVNFVTKTRRQLTAVFVFASVAIPALTYKSISENIVKFNTCFDFATKLDSTEANNLLTRLQNEANNTFGQNSKLSLKFKIMFLKRCNYP